MEARADLLQQAPERSLLRRPGTLPSLVRPALVYLNGQVVVLAVVWVSTNLAGKRLWDVLQSWDARQLLAVSQLGYPDSIEPAGLNSFAFFPAFPLAARWTSALSGLSPEVAGVLVSLACGIALAYAADAFAAGVLGADEPGRVRAVLWSRRSRCRWCSSCPTPRRCSAPWPCGPWSAGRGTAGSPPRCWPPARGSSGRPPRPSCSPSGWALRSPGAAGGSAAGGHWPPPPSRRWGWLAYLGYVALGRPGASRRGASPRARAGTTRFDYGRFTWTWLRALFQFGGGPMDGFIVAGAVCRGAHRGVAAAGAPRAARRGVRARRDRDRPRDRAACGGASSGSCCRRWS